MPLLTLIISIYYRLSYCDILLRVIVRWIITKIQVMWIRNREPICLIGHLLNILLVRYNWWYRFLILDQILSPSLFNYVFRHTFHQTSLSGAHCRQFFLQNILLALLILEYLILVLYRCHLFLWLPASFFWRLFCNRFLIRHLFYLWILCYFGLILNLHLGLIA